MIRWRQNDVSAHFLCFKFIISALSGNFTYRRSTSSVEVTRHMKNNLFPVALKLAPGGIFGTSNVNSSSSASVASKVNTNVSLKVTLIEVRFCRKTGTLFSKESNMTACVNRRLAISHGVLYKDCVIPWRDQRVLSQVKHTPQTLCWREAQDAKRLRHPFSIYFVHITLYNTYGPFKFLLG